MSYQRGDVVWGPDPFKSGENPRPWLILNNDTHPFGDEEYMTVTLTRRPTTKGSPWMTLIGLRAGCPDRATPHRGWSRRRSTLQLSGDRAD